jgi:hypothetical protein
MSLVAKRKTFRALGLGVVTAGAFLLAWSADGARSQLAEAVTRVEEDWVLVLNEPNNDVDSPQYHTVMSPFADFEESYAQVLWNYRETPEFRRGGVQMQAYYGESMTASRSLEFAQLNTSAETIRWTQSLQVNGTEVTFEVSNGTSQTWGPFGKDMRLAYASTVTNLAGYSWEFSAENSGPTYGSNRVDSMKISQVRYYGASGLLYTDTTPKMVFELDDSQYAH